MFKNISNKVELSSKNAESPIKRLLESIKKYYPNVAVIIADDSPEEEFEVVSAEHFPNVKQYKMPAYTGWFAGRALVISQVKTEARVYTWYLLQTGSH